MHCEKIRLSRAIQYSINEAYIDRSGTEDLWENTVTAANTIKDKIHQEPGFTVNVGISSNKCKALLSAKILYGSLPFSLFKSTPFACHFIRFLFSDFIKAI